MTSSAAGIDKPFSVRIDSSARTRSAVSRQLGMVVVVIMVVMVVSVAMVVMIVVMVVGAWRVPSLLPLHAASDVRETSGCGTRAPCPQAGVRRCATRPGDLDDDQRGEAGDDQDVDEAVGLDLADAAHVSG